MARVVRPQAEVARCARCAVLCTGAALYDALGQEPELREHRARAIAGHVDTDFVERSIQEAISQVRGGAAMVRAQAGTLTGRAPA